MNGAGGRDDRLARHLRECLSEADKQHTPEEILAAELALSEAPCAPQPSLFAAPPNAGLITGGQPETPVLAEGSPHGVLEQP